MLPVSGEAAGQHQLFGYQDFRRAPRLHGLVGGGRPVQRAALPGRCVTGGVPVPASGRGGGPGEKRPPPGVFCCDIPVNRGDIILRDSYACGQWGTTVGWTVLSMSLKLHLTISVLKSYRGTFSSDTVSNVQEFTLTFSIIVPSSECYKV